LSVEVSISPGKRGQGEPGIYNFDVPFDNSQAKIDIIINKFQQKISGTFRSAYRAKTFCRIRGYISTVRKSSLSVINSIQAAFERDRIIISAMS
jgi:hypothetical protein